MKINEDSSFYFQREDFFGNVYMTQSEMCGFTQLMVYVNGHHPKKRMIDTTRTYLVVDGAGEFIINDKKYEAVADDLFVIKPGNIYSYSGKMKLWETNISPENSFKDEIIK